MVAAVYDGRYRRIPNWLTLAGWMAGVGLNVWLSGWTGLRAALLGFALAFAVYLPLYLLRGVGGGDVKLMGAVGAITGPSAWLSIFVITALLGGAAALVILLSRGRLGRALGNIGYLLWELAHGRPPYAREELDVRSGQSMKLPHGVVIACGSLVYLAAYWV